MCTGSISRPFSSALRSSKANLSLELRPNGVPPSPGRSGLLLPSSHYEHHGVGQHLAQRLVVIAKIIEPVATRRSQPAAEQTYLQRGLRRVLLPSLLSSAFPLPAVINSMRNSNSTHSSGRRTCWHNPFRVPRPPATTGCAVDSDTLPGRMGDTGLHYSRFLFEILYV